MGYCTENNPLVASKEIPINDFGTRILVEPTGKLTVSNYTFVISKRRHVILKRFPVDSTSSLVQELLTGKFFLSGLSVKALI